MTPPAGAKTMRLLRNSRLSITLLPACAGSGIPSRGSDCRAWRRPPSARPFGTRPCRGTWRRIPGSPAWWASRSGEAACGGAGAGRRRVAGRALEQGVAGERLRPFDLSVAGGALAGDLRGYRVMGVVAGDAGLERVMDRRNDL